LIKEDNISININMLYFSIGIFIPFLLQRRILTNFILAYSSVALSITKKARRLYLLTNLCLFSVSGVSGDFDRICGNSIWSLWQKIDL